MNVEVRARFVSQMRVFDNRLETPQSRKHLSDGASGPLSLLLTQIDQRGALNLFGVSQHVEVLEHLKQLLFPVRMVGHVLAQFLEAPPPSRMETGKFERNGSSATTVAKRESSDAVVSP